MLHCKTVTSNANHILNHNIINDLISGESLFLYKGPSQKFNVQQKEIHDNFSVEPCKRKPTVRLNCMFIDKKNNMDGPFLWFIEKHVCSTCSSQGLQGLKLIHWFTSTFQINIARLVKRV